ncbi:DUF6694 family lipoprotein [Marilutibacter spongiae]|uniref:Uncharacterized protein n=1 Tax=Marilutibacter spongiae TaxID=2025720 RepID=A0A7W3TPB4_9GAMM|nr:DUF6694 family lipoprotein [Lysobacter spongiae]MBB1062007.1 hypothetical protein [Lysobacter spongiae]
MKKEALAACLAIALAACAASGTRPDAPRLDATSDASAQSSFKQMIEALPGEQRIQLQLAMVAINLKDVKSAYEVVNDPSLQSPSIVRIKEEVDGMTAQEIIDYAAEVADMQMEVEVGPG